MYCAWIGRPVERVSLPCAVVLRERVELSRVSPLVPKTSVYTISPPQQVCLRDKYFHFRTACCAIIRSPEVQVNKNIF